MDPADSSASTKKYKKPVSSYLEYSLEIEDPFDSFLHIKECKEPGL